MHGEDLPRRFVHADHPVVIEADGCTLVGARNHFEVQTAVLFVGVEGAPVGAEIDLGFEGGRESFGGFDSAGRAVEVGECGAGVDDSWWQDAVSLKLGMEG